jgi:succinoglycan biosynthesis transport protein ExoP
LNSNGTKLKSSPGQFYGETAEVNPSPAISDGSEINLGDLLQALRRRRRLAIAVFIVTVIVGALHTAWQRAYSPVFQGGFKLLVSDPINADDRSSGAEGGPIASVAIQGKASLNTGTLIQVLTSPLLLSPLEQRLGLADGQLGSIIITTPKSSGSEDGVLEVSLLWPDPDQGLEILRNVSREYLAYSLRQRQEKLTQGLAFLDRQAPELQARVTSLQNRLALFRQRSGFVEPAEQAAAIQAQQQSLSNNRKDLEQEQAKLEGLIQAVQRGGSATYAGTAAGNAPSSSTSDSQSEGSADKPADSPKGQAASGALLQDLFQVEKQLAEAEAIYTDSAPQVRELRAKRDTLRPLLQRRTLDTLRTQYSENQSRLLEIRRQQDQLARRFLVNPLQMQQYEALQQQLAVARDNLTSYIKARENFRLQVAQRTVPWSILVPPRFGIVPVKPSVSRSLMTSVILGLVAGAGLALLRDRLDHVFHTPKELYEGLAMPLLGVVPYLPGRTTTITITQSLASLEGGERFAIKESLRNLFANFRLLRADKPVRLVAITSSTQGEGKSTTTALFAETLAQLGQRVLLVDADMRRPMLHRYIGADNAKGLSSLLTDMDFSVADAVQHLQSGLDLISSGPIPPDPTQLLSSERCRMVIQAIRDIPDYDIVIFDTPPILLLSDPILLAEHLDGLLFLVGLSRVNRDLPAQSLQRVRDTGVDVLGVLANHPLRSAALASQYGYGYGRGYRYGYGYGYGPAAGYGDYARAAALFNGQGTSVEEDVSVVIEPLPAESKTTERKNESEGKSKLKKKRFHLFSWRTGSRGLMRWLDERE